MPRFRAAAIARLPALFVLLTAVPLGALGWLGWRMLQQERVLDAQRSRERVEDAAALILRELERSVAAWQDMAAATAQGLAVTPSPEVVVLRFDTDGVVESRGARLAFYPVVQARRARDEATFARGEALEFRSRDLDGAAAEYRRLAASADRAVRAGALMRLARCLRKQTRIASALDVYRELAELADTNVAGAPAELVARRERIVLFERIGDRGAAARETAALSSALADARFLIDRPTFDFFYATLGDAHHHTDSAARESFRLAEAVEALWRVRRDDASESTAWVGESGAYVGIWRRAGAQRAAVFGSVESLLLAASPLLDRARVRIGLEDASGQPLWGDSRIAGDGAARSFRAAGLPWTLHVEPSDPAALDATFASRRNLFIAGFGLMTLVIAAAGYFVFRAVNRELGVARLQSDFVAAVSHEFRTPLAAMCHLTEVLEEGAAPPERLPRYYGALRNESRRLQSMVETLLDFGRIEAGRRTYELVETDPAALVGGIVREFRERTPATAHRLVFAEPPTPDREQTRVRADRDALSLVVRNLVDNAIKYSPAASTVTIAVSARGAFVGISVEDRGPGLSRDEQRSVLRKFVRGSAARASSVKGTGIGLTMAAEIVKAHGGRLEVESELGRGSRFTALVPLLHA